MRSVTFQITVNKTALSPGIQADVGLDIDDSKSLTQPEVQKATKQSDGSYVASFQIESTAGRLWAVILRASSGSTYTISAHDDQNRALLSAVVHGVVAANNRGGSIGLLL